MNRLVSTTLLGFFCRLGLESRPEGVKTTPLTHQHCLAHQGHTSVVLLRLGWSVLDQSVRLSDLTGYSTGLRNSHVRHGMVTIACLGMVTLAKDEQKLVFHRQ